MITTLIVGIVVLSALIIAHELGHFIAAKAFGVWVEEFGVGFPPRVWGIKRGDTIYSINAIPFGGFNKISGEIDPKAPRSLAGRSAGVRLVVMAGGILVNLLLPLVLLSVAFMVPHDVTVGQVTVQQVFDGSPAAAAGIEVGDVILSFNGEPVNSYGTLARDTQLNLGKKVTMTVRHADATIEMILLVPRWRPPEGQGAVGVMAPTLNAATVKEHYPFFAAIGKGVTSCLETLVLYKNGIIGMIVGTVPVVMTGPVGIVQVTGEAAKAGISPVLELAAFISIAVAVTQLIPFPALDGGRILFVLIEVLRRGKRISPRVENMVHNVGFIVLLALVAAITYQDILRIISGGSLLG